MVDKLSLNGVRVLDYIGEGVVLRAHESCEGGVGCDG